MFTEPEFNIKTLVESSTNGARCVRIFGSRKTLREFQLHRTCERLAIRVLPDWQEDICQTTHRTRDPDCVKTILKIHEELVLRGMKVDCGERGEVLKLSAQLALGAGIRQTSLDYLASVFELASDELSEICSKSVMAGEDGLSSQAWPDGCLRAAYHDGRVRLSVPPRT